MYSIYQNKLTNEMRQFKNNLKRNRRNHSDRSFKRVNDVDRLNGNFANNEILLER